MGPEIICSWNVGQLCKRQHSTARCSSKQVRFHNAETLCEGIITQKRFVKKRIEIFKI
jgi:hypothetical protein